MLHPSHPQHASIQLLCHPTLQDSHLVLHSSQAIALIFKAETADSSAEKYVPLIKEFLETVLADTVLAILLNSAAENGETAEIDEVAIGLPLFAYFPKARPSLI